MNISRTIRNIVYLAVCLLCVALYGYGCIFLCVRVLTLFNYFMFLFRLCVCCYHLMVNKDVYNNYPYLHSLLFHDLLLPSIFIVLSGVLYPLYDDDDDDDDDDDGLSRRYD